MSARVDHWQWFTWALVGAAGVGVLTLAGFGAAAVWTIVNWPR